MMMVNYVPMEQSQAFAPGTPIVTRNPAAFYLGPGTNYGLVGTAPAGTAGEIIPDGNGLDGVLAKGTYWWKVTTGGLTGWVSENDLSVP